MNFRTYAAMEGDDVARAVKTSLDRGLSAGQAQERLGRYGKNVLEEQKLPAIRLFLRQFHSPFMVLLCVALILSLVSGDWINGALVGLIIAVNVLLSFVQEYRADQALRALRNKLSFSSRVLRDGVEIQCDSKELVPGDIVIIKAGDFVPADIRLVKVEGLVVDESSLTGESAAVAKVAEQIKTVTNIFDAHNYIFWGTTIAGGCGIGIVTATGDETELGGISQLASQVAQPSAFQIKINRLSKLFFILVVAVLAAFLFFHFVIKGSSVDVHQLILFALALAISVVPEALPAVTTVALSRGALQLAQHEVIVKRLSAIEDLGSITILCSDKTGTLTQNILTVADTLTLGKEDPLLYGLLAADDAGKSVLNNFDGALRHKQDEAMRTALAHYTKEGQIPFEPQRRRNTVIVSKNDQRIIISRGALEAVLGCCSLTHTESQALQAWAEAEGKKGRRVIALAARELSATSSVQEELSSGEAHLIPIGMISFEDPLKPTARQTIKKAQQLGITMKMITGDSPDVACFIAQQVGLVDTAVCALTGAEFEALSAQEQHAAVHRYAVFARITPQQKYRIVDLLREDNVVGFLGEGVNDVPVLKAAHVGIVVQDGTDIAKDAADIVLLRRSLTAILDGIEIGRTIFANTTKYIKVTLTSNLGNFYSIALASLLLDYLPMLPLQVLLVNFISDFPMIALATDRVDPDDLARPVNYDTNELAFFAGIFGSMSSVFDFMFFAVFRHFSPAILQSCWFVGSILTELVVIFSFRSKRFFLTARRPSLSLLILACCAALGAFLLPNMAWSRQLFSLTFLHKQQWFLIGLIVGGYLITNEAMKLVYYAIKNARRPSDKHQARTGQ